MGCGEQACRLAARLPLQLVDSAAGKLENSTHTSMCSQILEYYRNELPPPDPELADDTKLRVSGAHTAATPRTWCLGVVSRQPSALHTAPS